MTTVFPDDDDFDGPYERPSYLHAVGQPHPDDLPPAGYEEGPRGGLPRGRLAVALILIALAVIIIGIIFGVFYTDAGP